MSAPTGRGRRRSGLHFSFRNSAPGRALQSLAERLAWSGLFPLGRIYQWVKTGEDRVGASFSVAGRAAWGILIFQTAGLRGGTREVPTVCKGKCQSIYGIFRN